MRLSLALLCCLLPALARVNAQESLPLTLDRAIDLAFRQSFTVRNAKEQYAASRNRAEAQSLIAATTVDLSLSLPDYNESLTNQFNPLLERYEFYQLRTTLMRSTMTINQPVSLTGGSFTLSGDFFQRNQLSGLSGSSQTINDYFSYFQFQVEQPILAPNALKIAVDQANLQREEAISNFTQGELDAVYQVTDAFYTAYRLSRQEEISAEQVKQNEESYETAKSKFEAGLIPEVDLLQTEVDLVTSRNQRLTDQQEASRTMNALKVLLDLPLDRGVVLQADLGYTPLHIDSATAVGKALSSRSDLLNARRDAEIAAMNVDLVSGQRHLKLDLTASYGLNQNASEPELALRDFGRTRGVALALTVPIFDWGRHAREVEAAEAQRNSAEMVVENTKRQIRQDIIDLLSRIALAESRIQVLSKSVDVAQKSYEISIERFQAGTITRNDLAQAQQRLTTSKVNSLVAMIDYRLGLADLTRRTGWDFEKNRPAEVPIAAE